MSTTLKETGSWMIKYEQDPTNRYPTLTNEYQDYVYDFVSTSHWARAIVFYERDVNQVFLNIKNIQLTHLLPEAIRPGYIFRGWYTDAEDGTRISKDTVVTNDRIYYAHWETPKIDVNTFVDGVQIDSRNYEGDLKNKFKFDIYINGEIKGNQVGDYNGNVLYGTSYQITNLTYDTDKYEIDTNYIPTYIIQNNNLSGTINNKQHNHTAYDEYICFTLAFKTKE